MDRLLRLFRNRPQDDAQLTKAVEDLRRDLRTLVERLPARRPEDQALAGVKKDLHAISGRLKRMEQTAQHLGAEQRSIRMLLENLSVPGRADMALATQPVPTDIEDLARPKPDAGEFSVTMITLAACPMCGETRRTLVCEYNRLVQIGARVAEPVKRYDYSLCHGCGVTYAACRPTGSTFAALFERFDDNLGRSERNLKRSLLLTPGPLSDSDREALASRLSAGTFVSEHLEKSPKQYLVQLQRDRFAASLHAEVLGSLVPLSGARVLEVRSRFGSLLAILQRVHAVEPFAMAMTEAQQFVIEQAQGIAARHLIDFDEFTIPYEGTFELIAANHMMTHALRPDVFLDEVRRHLTPGGHLYLYNEPDDVEFLDGGASMINTLNPFHMQAFDRRSLLRALAANGFEPVFVGHDRGNLMVLTRWTGESARPQMAEAELATRLAKYRTARDFAVLRLPEQERWRYRDEWEAVAARALAAGVAGFDEDARLHAARRGGARHAEDVD